MANNLLPQSEEHPMQMNVDVQDLYTIFNARSPLGINTLIVPNELMVQAVDLWLQVHPQEAIQVIRALKNKQSADLDIIRTIHKTKN